MPTFELDPTDEAKAQLAALEADGGLAKQLKAVRKALGRMQTNLRHPALNTHEFKGTRCPHGDTLYEAYAQNKTAGAYRIFWCYSTEKGHITIVAITPHP